MKLLVFIILLFSFFGCRDKDGFEAIDPPAVSEECKALETLYTAYNNYYTCNDKDDLFGGISYQSGNAEEKEQAELKVQKVKKCAHTLTESYTPVSIKIREQMLYFHNAYQYVEKGVIEDVAENEIPQGQFTTRLSGCMQTKTKASKDDPTPFKQCFKELGDKAYQESKTKFKCK